MERGASVEDDSSAPTETRTLEEQLDELCFYYMSIGVPYEEFWYGDYCKLKYYEEVYMRQRKIRNEEMWMMGVYNFAAHQTVIGNAFRGKGHKAQEYMTKPISFFPKTEAELKAEAEEQKRKTIEYLNAFAKAFAKKEKQNGR